MRTALIALMLIVLSACSPRVVTETRWQRDTLTVERAVERWAHDTLTIHSHDTVSQEVVRYDTVGRVRERVIYQKGGWWRQSQGLATVVHDTITVQQGSTQAATKVVQVERKRALWETVLMVLGVGTIIATIGSAIVIATIKR